MFHSDRNEVPCSKLLGIFDPYGSFVILNARSWIQWTWFIADYLR